MNRFASFVRLIAAMAFVVTITAVVHAQSPITPRTWIAHFYSGPQVGSVPPGNDANAFAFEPCNREQPCQSFGGAFAATKTGGEINALTSDSFNDFSDIVITRSITLDGGAVLAGLTARLGADAITINAGPTGVVILRNLTINGLYKAGLGGRGIRIISAKEVYIDNVNIQNFTTAGIRDERPSASGTLVVRNTTIRSVAGSGISLQPSGSINATLEKIWLEGNGTGLSSSGSALTMFKDSTVNHNGTGISTGSGSSIIGLSRVTVALNSVGVSLGGGMVLSYGNNEIVGNASGNGPLSGPVGFQ